MFFCLSLLLPPDWTLLMSTTKFDGSVMYNLAVCCWNHRTFFPTHLSWTNDGCVRSECGGGTWTGSVPGLVQSGVKYLSKREKVWTWNIKLKEAEEMLQKQKQKFQLMWIKSTFFHLSDSFQSRVQFYRPVQHFLNINLEEKRPNLQSSRFYFLKENICVM